MVSEVNFYLFWMSTLCQEVFKQTYGNRQSWLYNSDSWLLWLEQPQPFALWSLVLDGFWNCVVPWYRHLLVNYRQLGNSWCVTGVQFGELCIIWYYGIIYTTSIQFHIHKDLLQKLSNLVKAQICVQIRLCPHNWEIHFW